MTQSALHLHCALLKIPDDADRTELLATISADPRVKLAQPLQTFATLSQDDNDPTWIFSAGCEN